MADAPATPRRAGDSYVIFGQASGFADIDSGDADGGPGLPHPRRRLHATMSGSSVSSAGDVNGDGFDDLIVGARSGDAAGNAKNDAGESTVIFGRDFTRRRGVRRHGGGRHLHRHGGGRDLRRRPGQRHPDRQRRRRQLPGRRRQRQHRGRRRAAARPRRRLGHRHRQPRRQGGTDRPVRLNSSRFARIEKIDLTGSRRPTRSFSTSRPCSTWRAATAMPSTTTRC